MREEDFEALLRKAETERDSAIRAAEAKYQQDQRAIQRVWELSRELVSRFEPSEPEAAEPEVREGPTKGARPDDTTERAERPGRAEAVTNRSGTLRQALKAVSRPGEQITAQTLFERLPSEVADKSSVASVSATVGSMAEKKDWFDRVIHGKGGRPSVYLVLGDNASGESSMPHPEDRVDDQPTIFEGEQGAVDPAQ